MMPPLWVTVPEKGELLVRGVIIIIMIIMIIIITHTCPHLLSPPHLGTHPGPLLPGSRQIRLVVPGAYEKPQLLPLQPPLEAEPPATFTFHVNPVLRSKLDVELGENLMVLQVSEPRSLKRWMIDSVLPEQCSGASVQAVSSKYTSWCFLPCRVTRVLSWRPRAASWERGASCSLLWP